MDEMWLTLRLTVHIIYSPLSFFIKVPKRSHYVSIICSLRSCKTIPRLTHFLKSFKHKISPSFRTCRGSALLSLKSAPQGFHLHTGSCNCFFRKGPSVWGEDGGFLGQGACRSGGGLAHCPGQIPCYRSPEAVLLSHQSWLGG